MPFCKGHKGYRTKESYIKQSDEHSIWNKGKKTGLAPWLGKKRSEETKRKISAGHLGKTPWNKGKKGQVAWNKGIKYTEEQKSNLNMDGLKKGRGLFKGKERLDIIGERHWNWEGGKTKEGEKIRKSSAYKQWREAVFLRDNYTCVFCKRKETVSGKLNADHIKPFALFPELRLVIDNGRTLCIDCHKNTDTYFNNFKKKYAIYMTVERIL